MVSNGTWHQFPHGSANLTYLLRVGAHELVLRRPPMGKDHLSGVFRLLKRAGIYHHRVYDLHHTYAACCWRTGRPSPT